ncbi:hypothetical protein LEP1GSC171_0897 [Leptospira santarosai str. HAI1380]|uniref:Uncharacterized protein n=5 Tax=Leptospira santarosai TaxID=28183 RepID=A0AB73MEA5_9LEPT|nr:hypothetical protein B2G51_07040 [Leptospira santarosai]EKO35582.1 hypothetical protein LEP1GSC179_1029 [Leptospira santarosai str. MOR084]EKS09619.1 hypothetical protein LEP1GSC071_1214 [Leptospira santarosai str. JET]EMF89216.1 hypothetical protein LEP1GSC005_0719 [Leptospira santarosai str. ST188]EMJ49648.1 hypothetical protein LEP1GSC169_2712 [Leptospira santarosai str. HAI1349]EMM78965.1 hypothetical protein LEP1GSC040_2180 [Leptospira santarosai str. 2000030832]EMM85363.1 hypothetica
MAPVKQIQEFFILPSRKVRFRFFYLGTMEDNDFVLESRVFVRKIKRVFRLFQKTPFKYV